MYKLQYKTAASNPAENTQAREFWWLRKRVVDYTALKCRLMKENLTHLKFEKDVSAPRATWQISERVEVKLIIYNSITDCNQNFK